VTEADTPTGSGHATVHDEVIHVHGYSGRTNMGSEQVEVFHVAMRATATGVTDLAIRARSA
jgi:hypothetical protein